MPSITALDSSLTLIKALTKAMACNTVETHISWVLLTGQYAYKIKKPVNFGFLDFSTLENRRFCCYEELRLNQRLAPDLYLGVVPITGSLENPKIGGSGRAIDYAIEMRQFPAGHLLSEYAGRGQLEASEIDQLADMVAHFHQTIDQTDRHSPYGHSGNIKHWFDGNFDVIKPLLGDNTQQLQLLAIQQWGGQEWLKLDGFMQQRRLQGYVRECHGDLHLGNMTLNHGKLVLFDCIEFNPLLRWIDLISEVAFLFIDLVRFGYGQLAFRFLNRYLQHTGDYQGLALLRYYVVYRALVRAKVALLRKAQQSENSQTRDEYAIYVGLAGRFTTPCPKGLIITHGYSGSGKTTLAGQLAEKIGAFMIRSDIERKRLFGYQAMAQTDSSINAGLYNQEASLQTYGHLKTLAKTVLEAGFPVIVDAAFLKAGQREMFRQLAADCGVPFHIIDFQASTEELCRRITQRQQDASEATVAVLSQQQQTAEPLSEQEETGVIRVDTEKEGLDGLLKRFVGWAPCPNWDGGKAPHV